MGTRNTARPWSRVVLITREQKAEQRTVSVPETAAPTPPSAQEADVRRAELKVVLNTQASLFPAGGLCRGLLLSHKAKERKQRKKPK